MDTKTWNLPSENENKNSYQNLYQSIFLSIFIDQEGKLSHAVSRTSCLKYEALFYYIWH